MKRITAILSVNTYKNLKILVNLKDTTISKYVNDLINRDLELNKDKIKKYLELLEKINKS